MVWTFSDPARLLALVSALPLILFALVPLRVRPLMSQHVFAALFAGAWGLQIAASSLSQLTLDPAVHDGLYRAGLFLYLAVPLFLIQFSASHPFRNGPTHKLPGMMMPVALVLPGTVLLWFHPDAIFTTVLVDGAPAPVFRGLATPLVFAPFFIGFYYAAYRQFRLSRSAKTALARARSRLVALGLLIFVGHSTGRNFLAFVNPGPHEAVQDQLVLLSNTVLFGGGMLLVLGFAAMAAFQPGARKDVDVAVLVVVFLVLAFESVTHVLSRAGIGIDTGWLFRLATVALLVYGLIRFRLFDIDVRHRSVLIAAVPAGALVLAALIVAGLVSARGLDQATVTTAAVLLLLVVWVARRAPVIAERLLLVGDGEAEYVYHRKLEVYRAALEERSREGTLPPPEDESLRRMRRRLGISDSEHHALAFMVAKTRGTMVGGMGGSGATQRISPGQVILDRYRIDRLLGSGQYGRVYLAHDERDARPVVVKVVGTTAFGGHAAHLLVREARILAGLDDPYIVKVEACHETDDDVVLVLEHVAGGDLAGLLQRRGRLGLREASHLVGGVLRGLEAAHAAGVVHRDLKPENVLLTDDGQAKLADFGVARQAGPTSTVAADGGPVGTLLYMSPEQVRGDQVDARADLYAVGALMHRLVTGRHYLRVAGRDDFQIRRMILESEPDLDRGSLSEGLCDWLTRALAKDPAERWTDAGEMRRALHRLDEPALAPAHSVAAATGAEP